MLGVVKLWSGEEGLSAEEIDPTAFWNADPPEDDGEEMLPMDCPLMRKTIIMPFEINDGMAAPIYEVRFDGPLEDWIDDRFVLYTPCMDGPTTALLAFCCLTHSAALSHFRRNKI